MVPLVATANIASFWRQGQYSLVTARVTIRELPNDIRPQQHQCVDCVINPCHNMA
jgi:hypothetical protein